jgi:hypothetical protein
MVEIFSEDSQPVAAHSRLTGVGKFSTFEAHYPEKKLSVARFDAYSDEIATDSEANRRAFRRKSAVREVGAKRRWDFVHSLSVV